MYTILYFLYLQYFLPSIHLYSQSADHTVIITQPTTELVSKVIFQNEGIMILNDTRNCIYMHGDRIFLRDNQSIGNQVNNNPSMSKNVMSK